MVCRLALERSAFFVDVDGTAYSRAVDEDTPSDCPAERGIGADEQILNFADLGVDRHCGDLGGAPHGWEVDLKVECISKGKADKRYEFAVKGGVVATLRVPFILAAQSLAGNPYDGHTLAWSLAKKRPGSRPWR